MLEFTTVCIVCQKERVVNFNNSQSNICPRCERLIQELDNEVINKKCIFCGTEDDVHYWEGVLGMICENCKYSVIGS